MIGEAPACGLEAAGAAAMSTSLEIFLLAVAFDLAFGEPPARIHPVVWIGRLIAFCALGRGPPAGRVQPWP